MTGREVVIYLLCADVVGVFNECDIVFKVGSPHCGACVLGVGFMAVILSGAVGRVLEAVTWAGRSTRLCRRRQFVRHSAFAVFGRGLVVVVGPFLLCLSRV